MWAFYIIEKKYETCPSDKISKIEQICGHFCQRKFYLRINMRYFIEKISLYYEP